jgi:carbonic anhydrase
MTLIRVASLTNYGGTVRTVEITYRYQDTSAGERPRPEDTDAAVLRLSDGNRTFAELLESVKKGTNPVRRIVRVDPRDLGLVPEASAAASQRPFAAVLGCSDARVPLELIFNEGLNDLFVIRVAGNGLGSDVLGSLKYAVDHLGDSLKLIVVLGHSGCGAVSAATDVFLNPGEYLSLVGRQSLREVLDRLLVVVRASARKLEAAFGPQVSQRKGYRRALIEASIVTNAALGAYSVQQEVAAQGSLRAVFGVYLLETHRVWTPRLGHPDGGGLAPAPRDIGGFQDLGDAMMQSSRLVALLGE